MATTADRDVDIIGFYRENQRLALQLFTMREGRIVGRREFFWEDLPDDDLFNSFEFLREVLIQYYSTDYVPLEIHVPQDFDDRAILEQLLSERRGRKVKILDPKRGKNRHLVTLVETNAKIAFEQRFRVLKPDSQKVLEELQELFELSYFPERIESFDISNISGSENVAGIVAFENGKPARVNYRRLIIKSVDGANDFASMHEAVFRRYRRQKEEEQPLPEPHLHRRRQGPAARRRRDASTRSRANNARRARQTAKTAQSDLASADPRPRRSANPVRPQFARVPPDFADPRRNAQNRHRVSPQTPRETRFLILNCRRFPASVTNER
ncbi:MAG: hypothetical protein IPK98_14510 [Chloracidobacterium sp.]|nr:hypothetical protein [Chloracidobacterium sp.]